MRLPPLDAVTAIVAVFEGRGWPVAVGGSAVLAWLGLVDTVRDWDVTVDADPDEVRHALLAAGFEPEDRTSHEHPFATRCRLTLTLADHEIDVLVGFALSDGAAIVPIPVRVAGQWQGLPVAHPVDWELAYRLMGRSERAAMLREHLAKSDWIER